MSTWRWAVEIFEGDHNSVFQRTFTNGGLDIDYDIVSTQVVNDAALIKTTAQLLKEIRDNTAGGGGAVETFTGPTETSASGTITAGKKSISVVNVGAANGVFNGQPIRPGYPINISAQPGNTLAEITYDGTGTTLIIAYTA